MAENRGGPIAFLREALALLANPRLVAPALALTVLLTASNIVVASNVPAEGEKLGPAFAVAAFVRVAGILVLAVAILRTMTGSARPDSVRTPASGSTPSPSSSTPESAWRCA